MSYPSSELFHRVWQEAMRVVLLQHQVTDHFHESVIHQPGITSKGLVNNISGLIKCPCLMTHALLFPGGSVKKRKRKRRKKRRQLNCNDKVSIIRSVR